MINPEQLVTTSAIQQFSSLSTDELVKINLKMNAIDSLEPQIYEKIQHLLTDGKFHNLVNVAFQRVLAQRLET